jgi:ubiquitin C-terminal hydrolase
MHQGVLEGGHYWANVRQNGRWFEMDDETVREV